MIFLHVPEHPFSHVQVRVQSSRPCRAACSREVSGHCLPTGHKCASMQPTSWGSIAFGFPLATRNSRIDVLMLQEVEWSVACARLITGRSLSPRMTPPLQAIGQVAGEGGLWGGGEEAFEVAHSQSDCSASKPRPQSPCPGLET